MPQQDVWVSTAHLWLCTSLDHIQQVLSERVSIVWRYAWAGCVSVYCSPWALYFSWSHSTGPVWARQYCMKICLSRMCECLLLTFGSVLLLITFNRSCLSASVLYEDMPEQDVWVCTAHLWLCTSLDHIQQVLSERVSIVWWYASAGCVSVYCSPWALYFSWSHSTGPVWARQYCMKICLSRMCECLLLTFGSVLLLITFNRSCLSASVLYEDMPQQDVWVSTAHLGLSTSLDHIQQVLSERVHLKQSNSVKINTYDPPEVACNEVKVIRYTT